MKSYRQFSQHDDPLKSVRCFKCGCFGHRGNQCAGQVAYGMGGIPMHPGGPRHRGGYSSYKPAPNDGLEKCWICGCLGHKAKDCTEEQVTCFSCGARGHKQEDCTSPMANCWNCGKPGHIKRDCPLKKNVGMCFHCHKVGHHSKNCDMKACYVCGSKDHLYTRCPFKDSRAAGGPGGGGDRGGGGGPPHKRRNRRNQNKRQPGNQQKQNAPAQPSGFPEHLFPAIHQEQNGGFAFGQDLLETQSARSHRSSTGRQESPTHSLPAGGAAKWEKSNLLSADPVPTMLRPRSAPLEDASYPDRRRPSTRVLEDLDEATSRRNILGGLRPPCTRPNSYGGPTTSRNQDDEDLDNLDIMGLLYRDEEPENGGRLPGGGTSGAALAEAWGNIAKHQRARQQRLNLPRCPSVETKPFEDDLDIAEQAIEERNTLRPPANMFRRGLSVETCAVSPANVHSPSTDQAASTNRSHGRDRDTDTQVSTSPWTKTPGNLWQNWGTQQQTPAQQHNTSAPTEKLKAKAKKTPVKPKSAAALIKKRLLAVESAEVELSTPPVSGTTGTTDRDHQSVAELTASVASMDMAESPESLRNTLDVPLPPSLRSLELAKVDSPGDGKSGGTGRQAQSSLTGVVISKEDFIQLREELRRSKQMRDKMEKQMAEKDKQIQKLQVTVTQLKSAAEREKGR